jgi:YihY family inner membrane protein
LREVGQGIYQLPVVHGVLSTLVQTFRAFAQDDAHILAAALAFYAILSMIPFVLLLFSVAGYLIEHMAQRATDGHALFHDLAEYIRAVVPFVTDDVVERLRAIALRREALGLTGLGILVMTSWLVFRTLEMTFYRVFKAERRRSLVASQLLHLLFMLGVGLVFLLVHLTGVLAPLGSGRSESLAALFDRALGQFAGLRIAATLFVGTLVFVVLVKYFSHERVRFRAAAVGGGLFALLWMLASLMFGAYLKHIARFSLLYGSLASLAVIVVWFFYAAVVLLWCAEFTNVLQNKLWPLRRPGDKALNPGSGAPSAG